MFLEISGLKRYLFACCYTTSDSFKLNFMQFSLLLCLKMIKHLEYIPLFLYRQHSCTYCLVLVKPQPC